MRPGELEARAPSHRLPMPDVGRYTSIGDAFERCLCRDKYGLLTDVTDALVLRSKETRQVVGCSSCCRI